MFVLVFRGTGLYILVYFAVSFLIWRNILDPNNFRDRNFGAYTFLCAAIPASLHAFVIWRDHRRGSGHGAHRSRGLWHDAFLLIPVTVWPVIFIAVSVYLFVS